MENRLDSVRPYIQCQFHHIDGETPPEKPFVTISRQAGCGGITIGRQLSAFLKNHDKSSKCNCDWEVYDKNLVEQVLKDHDFPEAIARFMPEEAISEIEIMINEVTGLQPSSITLLRKTSETIAHLACLGKVIIVGRGANVITGKIPGGVHVRLVGSLKKRLIHIQEYYGLNKKQAEDFIRKEDEGRKRYLKKHFDKNIDDPLLYGLILNTDEIPFDEAVQIIGHHVLRKLKESRSTFTS